MKTAPNQKMKNTAFLLAKALGAKDYKVTNTAFTIYFDDLNTSEACFLHLRDNYIKAKVKDRQGKEPATVKAVEWSQSKKAVRITF